jgi:hypothetical protein
MSSPHNRTLTSGNGCGVEGESGCRVGDGVGLERAGFADALKVVASTPVFRLITPVAASAS